MWFSIKLNNPGRRIQAFDQSRGYRNEKVSEERRSIGSILTGESDGKSSDMSERKQLFNCVPERPRRSVMECP
jgi:hypothetical protein